MGERVVHPFGPVFDMRSRVLVLGTMPSPASRERGFYYGHPRNRFWPVMASLWDEEIPASTQARRFFCLRHRVALWDVLAACVIEGASDATIARPISNDVASLLAQTGIHTVFCSGSAAARLYHRLVEPVVGIICVGLPSTSPANARYGLKELIDAYAVVRAAVEDD